MLRAPLLALLVFVLFTGTLQAQRGGGMARDGGGREGIGPGSGGHSGFRSRSPGDSRRHTLRNDAILYPFWYGDYDNYGEPFEEEQPAPPLMMAQSIRSRPAAQTLPPAAPMLIELPGTADLAVPAKPLPSAVFILTNGERLQAQRYLLTHDRLYLTISRQQRTIPLGMLDIEATVSANHQRGIELRIPADRNEISLSF
jgi:hypothetical protein